VTLVFLLEEPSMKAFLERFMPRHFPDIPCVYVAHEGKSDLEASIPRKLRAWRDPNARFVVIRDQDSADCKVVRRDLVARCEGAGRPDTLVRIACRELEAWFLGDLAGVEEATRVPGLARRQQERKFRDPDALGSPSMELRTIVPTYGKVAGARAMGDLLDVERCQSASFQTFVRGVRRIAESP
jgi:hypothetical protein